MNPFYPRRAFTQQYHNELLKRRKELPDSGHHFWLHLPDLWLLCVLYCPGIQHMGPGKTTQPVKAILFDEFPSGPTRGMHPASPGGRDWCCVLRGLGDRRCVVTLGGYKGRFDNRKSFETHFAFATDGLLLRVYESDPILSQYACIVIDEAHERTCNTDMLLALIKDTLTTRSDLKLVVMSATISIDKFCRYFNTTNVFEARRQAHSACIKYLDAH
ncbi:DEAH-box ATP-dependent RNA helicase prp43 [Fusarium torreyae]|uniref:DEAH-box ATP-dependent RNA helicase prp43 n=1 Tax=Fusarium torreyae TaxID=1237075 RepID=A0A9W8S302_9HYPO|nr:DEAH-box ATP-dependent RNA helicase prp43 [Fusarium torreyae]